MTDLEITKLCAEAMGLEVAEQLGMMMFLNTQFEAAIYGPLENDAQAMALVRKFYLDISYRKGWFISVFSETKQRAFHAEHLDLNRAICECVAKMEQSEKLTTAK